MKKLRVVFELRNSTGGDWKIQAFSVGFKSDDEAGEWVAVQSLENALVSVDTAVPRRPFGGRRSSLGGAV